MHNRREISTYLACVQGDISHCEIIKWKNILIRKFWSHRSGQKLSNFRLKNVFFVLCLVAEKAEGNRKEIRNLELHALFKRTHLPEQRKVKNPRFRMIFFQFLGQEFCQETNRIREIRWQKQSIFTKKWGMVHVGSWRRWWPSYRLSQHRSEALEIAHWSRSPAEALCLIKKKSTFEDNGFSASFSKRTVGKSWRCTCCLTPSGKCHHTWLSKWKIYKGLRHWFHWREKEPRKWKKKEACSLSFFSAKPELVERMWLCL